MLRSALNPLTSLCLLASQMPASAALAATTASHVNAGTNACTQPGRHPVGRTTRTLVSGGTQRRYQLFVPDAHAATSPLPLVLDFHGSGSSPDEELRINGMDRAAQRYGFVVAMPVALVAYPPGGHTWNIPPDRRLVDDVQFAKDVLDDVGQRVCIDEARINAAGFSGGARLASAVACAMPERIAGLGAVGGLRAPRDCQARSMPVIAFHGTRDPVNPYSGGGQDYWGYGIETAVHRWAALHRCGTALETRLSDTVVRRAYADCNGDRDVVLYRVEGGGHTWPGSRFPFPEERFGPTSRDIDATTLMLEFFQSHWAKGMPSRRLSGSGRKS